MKNQAKSSLLLFLAAVIWGCAFVAQSVSMDYIEPFTFNCVRNIIGSAVLVPCIWLLDRWKAGSEEGQQAQKSQEEKRKAGKTLWMGGICCGIALCIASNLQQFGILYASVGKAGFLTALYIIIVPVLGIFLGRKPGKKLWIAVVLALFGMYLLCMKAGNLAPGTGDIMLLLCAAVFSIHILIIDKYTNLVDGVRLSAIQFLVCGILSGIAMFVWETPTIAAILAAWVPVLYAGVFSSGVAYTLQVVGQKGMNPVIATLILSLESVVSALSGWILLGQILSTREIAGCIIVFIAIILAQLPEQKLLEKREEFIET